MFLCHKFDEIFLQSYCFSFVSGPSIIKKIRNVVCLSFCVTVVLCVLFGQCVFRYPSYQPFWKRENKDSCFNLATPDKLNESSSYSGTPNATIRLDFDLSMFYNVDLVSNNNDVNKLVRMLKTETEVINEIQRIHINIFQNVIGKYKYAMLFNIPGFENKGDPAIGVGEIVLLRKLNIELVFHLRDQSNTEKAIDYARQLSDQKKYTNNSLVILLHGGGNLLSYANQDKHRETVIRRFMEFEIVMFPQSFWKATTQEHIEYFTKVYSIHPRMTFCYRDQYSFEKGSELFPNARPLLVPDMAFQIGKVERFMLPLHDIMWLKRTDKENPHYRIPENASKLDIKVADWIEWKTPRDNRLIENGFLIAANGMMFLQRGRVVITDRLHGHILSILCGIPHVILNPINNKISKYRDTWTHGLENVEEASTPEEALEKATNLLKRLGYILPKIASFYNSVEY